MSGPQGLGYCVTAYSGNIKCESCYAALLLLRYGGKLYRNLCTILDRFYLSHSFIFSPCFAFIHTAVVDSKVYAQTIYYTCCCCWYSLKQTARMCVNSVHYTAHFRQKGYYIYLGSVEVLHLSQITFSEQDRFKIAGTID